MQLCVRFRCVNRICTLMRCCLHQRRPTQRRKLRCDRSSYQEETQVTKRPGVLVSPSFAPPSGHARATHLDKLEVLLELGLLRQLAKLGICLLASMAPGCEKVCESVNQVLCSGTACERDAITMPNMAVRNMQHRNTKVSSKHACRHSCRPSPTRTKSELDW